MNLAGAVAFVLFVIAAVLAFVDVTSIMNVLGLIAAGLAALVLAGSTWLGDKRIG